MIKIPAPLLEQLVALADESRKRITCDLASVRAVVDEADLVFAIWQDHSEPHGVGCRVIKGNQELQEIFAGGKSQEPRVAAIPCDSFEQAEALRQVAGEQDRRH
ncbi:hypothetical protein [Methylobacterium sp. CM6257]